MSDSAKELLELENACRNLVALIKSWAKDFDQHNTDFVNMLTATNESGRTKANLMKSSYA
ncbi:hypothetical protein M5G07_05575 [Serratia symbiotica]|nr:hypothetical protein [Serratia symbiotica]